MGCGRVVGRKLSGPRKDKEEGKKPGRLCWAKRRERKRGFGFFFFLKTHKLKQRHATKNDAQALG
jgi:hypothetical protein